MKLGSRSSWLSPDPLAHQAQFSTVFFPKNCACCLTSRERDPHSPRCLSPCPRLGEYKGREVLPAGAFVLLLCKVNSMLPGFQGLGWAGRRRGAL